MLINHFIHDEMKKDRLQSAVKSNPSYLLWMGYLQVITIFMVVLAHSAHEYPGYNSSFLVNALITFSMPTFMFASGYLLLYTLRKKQPFNGQGFKRLLRVKVKRLILPMLIVSVLVWLPRCLLSGLADDVVELSWFSFLDGLVGCNLVIPFYWFTMAAFWMITATYLVLVLSVRLDVNIRVGLLMWLIALLICNICGVYVTRWFAIYKLFALGPYFVIGALFATYDNTAKIFGGKLYFMLFAAMALLWCIAYWLIPYDSLSRLITSLTGVVMMVVLAKWVGQRGNRLLDWLLGSNYTIFLLSWFCNVATQQVLHHFTDWHWSAYTLLSVVTSMTIPVFIYKWVKRHPHNRYKSCLSFVLGIN